MIAREGIKPWNEPLLELEDFLEYIKDAESKFISDSVAKFFTKSLLREIETLLNSYDRLRAMLKEVMDLHMGNVERNTGRVNQLLTIIATVFLPITFIASIYGMNFEYMPELEQPWGYPAVLLLMASVALGLIILYEAPALVLSLIRIQFGIGNKGIGRGAMHRSPTCQVRIDAPRHIVHP